MGKDRYLKLFLLICLISNMGFLCAQNENNPSMTGNSKFLLKAEQYKAEFAPDDVDFKLVFNRKEKINDDPVYIYRFESSTSNNVTLNKAHITVILGEDGKLKGYARLNEDMGGDNKIDEKKGQAFASAFLNRHAPDLKEAGYQWSKIHEETIIGSDGKARKIKGLWVKYQERKSGEYLWVILAPDGTVMEFDRDIVWSFFRGGRVNELWLRDEWFGKWLAKNRKK